MDGKWVKKRRCFYLHDIRHETTLDQRPIFTGLAKYLAVCYFSAVQKQVPCLHGLRLALYQEAE